MECFSINNLMSRISQLQPGDWFIVDVDETLIAPRAMMFRPESAYSSFIDDLKKQNPANLVDVLSTWRLSRKIMLVEHEWPEVIDSLLKRNVTVLALTAMHTGSFGKIDSMESWRATELKSLGLNFSAFAQNNVEKLIDQGMPATIFQGIIFAGSHSKDIVLKEFVKKYDAPSKIVFLDDRIEQVELVRAACLEMNVTYEGYHYQAATLLPYNKHKDHGVIQMKSLLEQLRWFEDEDIEISRH